MNVVVTGGGTIAPIDDVRLMTNVSSGRFAAAITEACLDSRSERLAHPLVVSPASPAAICGVRTRCHRHAAELLRLTQLRERWRSKRDRLNLFPLQIGNVADYAATLEHVLRSHAIDVVFLPMAVADFEPEPLPGKISSDAESLVVHCRPTPKVIRRVRDWSPSVFLVGFKLLSRVSRDELVRRAELACRDNRADLTVANDLQTLRQGRHTVHLVRPGHDAETLEPGAELAERLVARVLTWANEPRPAVPASSVAAVEKA